MVGTPSAQITDPFAEQESDTSQGVETGVE
jgi:hypothetical protein